LLSLGLDGVLWACHHGLDLLRAVWTWSSIAICHREALCIFDIFLLLEFFLHFCVRNHSAVEALSCCFGLLYLGWFIFSSTFQIQRLIGLPSFSGFFTCAFVVV
jgi:hypothetical protein